MSVNQHDTTRRAEASEEGPRRQSEPFSRERDYEDFFKIWDDHSRQTNADLLQEREWQAFRVLYQKLLDEEIPAEHLLMTRSTLVEHALVTIRRLNGYGRSGERSADETIRDIARYLHVGGRLGLSIFRQQLIPKLLSLSRAQQKILLSTVLRFFASEWIHAEENPTIRLLYDREIVASLDYLFSESIHGDDRDRTPTPLLKDLEYTSSLLLMCQRYGWRRLATLILRWILKDPRMNKRGERIGRRAAFLPRLIRRMRGMGFDFRFAPFERFMVARVACFASSLGPVPEVLKTFNSLGGTGENAGKVILESLRAAATPESIVSGAMSWLSHHHFVLFLAETLEGEALWRRALGDRFPIFTPAFNPATTVVALALPSTSPAPPPSSVVTSTPATSAPPSSTSSSPPQASNVPATLSSSNKRKDRDEGSESLLEIAHDFLRRIKRRLF